MVKQQDKSSPPVWVAIDVAKRRNEVLIEYPDRGRRQRLSVWNTREAHDRLMSCNIALSRLVCLNTPMIGSIGRTQALEVSSQRPPGWAVAGPFQAGSSGPQNE